VACYHSGTLDSVLDETVAFLPVVVSVFGVLMSLKTPYSSHGRALRVLLVVFGIGVSGVTYFRYALEHRRCANVLLSAGIHYSIKPPQPIDWAVVVLPTLLSLAGVFVSLKAPSYRHHRALRVSLVVLGIAVGAVTFFWQMLIGLGTPCFLGG